ncbi:DUF433 domain-containing protein [bacterium]|nr:DUF433 domain-containing protein [bacterium]
MNDQQLLERITSQQNVLGGKPVIKGTRLSVEFILNLLAHGSTTEDILNEYKGLMKEDIHACLLFATKSLEDTTFMPLEPEMA